MTVADAQYYKLMKEHSESQDLVKAAFKAHLSVGTARKYIRLRKLPSQIKQEKGPRSYKTRVDAFAEHWPLVTEKLELSPGLQAKTLFEWLCSLHPDKFQSSQLRTFQRRVGDWRKMDGPGRLVRFQQNHRPGEAFQTDYTSMNKLNITIAGEAFNHLLCHITLPYSNWESVTISHSESILSLKRGIQTAVLSLQAVPKYHQTDNSTAATHHDGKGKRHFNKEYLEVMDYFEMTPRTTGIGQKEQNGDIESLNGAFKRRVEQQLLLRGSRDFDSRSSYQSWLNQICKDANRERSERINEELKHMKPVKKAMLPVFKTKMVRVSKFSHVRIAGKTYSVPSRLIASSLQAEIGEEEIVLKYKGKLAIKLPRLRGKKAVSIRIEDVIDSLVARPGAFRRIRYQSEFFPSLAFRKVYDELCAKRSEYRASSAYLQILKLTLEYGIDDVEAALCLAAEEKEEATASFVDKVCGLVSPGIPDLTIDRPDLSEYDCYFDEEAA